MALARPHVRACPATPTRKLWSSLLRVDIVERFLDLQFTSPSRGAGFFEQMITSRSELFHIGMQIYSAEGTGCQTRGSGMNSQHRLVKQQCVQRREFRPGSLARTKRVWLH